MTFYSEGFLKAVTSSYFLIEAQNSIQDNDQAYIVEETELVSFKQKEKFAKNILNID